MRYTPHRRRSHHNWIYDDPCSRIVHHKTVQPTSTIRKRKTRHAKTVSKTVFLGPGSLSTIWNRTNTACKFLDEFCSMLWQISKMQSTVYITQGLCAAALHQMCKGVTSMPFNLTILHQISQLKSVAPTQNALSHANCTTYHIKCHTRNISYTNQQHSYEWLFDNAHMSTQPALSWLLWDRPGLRLWLQLQLQLLPTLPSQKCSAVCSLACRNAKEVTKRM